MSDLPFQLPEGATVATPEEVAATGADMDLPPGATLAAPEDVAKVGADDGLDLPPGAIPATENDVAQLDHADRAVSLLSQGQTYAQRAKLAADNFEDPNLRPYLIKSLAGEMKARDARSLSERMSDAGGAATGIPSILGDAVGMISDAVQAAVKNAKPLLYDDGGIFTHPLESTPERARAYAEAMAAVQTAAYQYHGIVRKTAGVLSDTFNSMPDTTGFVSLRGEKPAQPNPYVRSDDVYESRAEADIIDAKTMAEVMRGSEVPESIKKQLAAKGPNAAMRPEEIEKLSVIYDPENIASLGVGAVVGAAAKQGAKTIVAKGLRETGEAAAKPGFAARAVGSVFGAVGERVVKSSENALLVGTLTGAAAAASGADTDTVVLASILGASGTRKSAVVSSALEKTGASLIRVGDKFAGRASFGPIGRFAEGSLAFVKPGLQGAAVGAAAQVPFLLGARDEEEVLNGMAFGAAFGLGGGLAGSTYARAADKFAIHNVFKSKQSQAPDSAYQRPEFTSYSPDLGHPLEQESKRIFDTLSNRGAQTVEALKKLFAKPGEDGLKTEIYLGGQAAANAFAKSMGLDSVRAGVTIDLKNEGRRVVFINADSNGGISLGHEVGHAWFDSLPKDKQQQTLDFIQKNLSDEQFFELRNRYAELFNQVRDAEGNLAPLPKDKWKYELDAYYVREYIAENFSAYLNGIPAEKLGTPRNIADRIRVSIGALLEKSGARKLTADGSAAVQTPLGYKPSAALAQMFDNFMQARKLENTTLPGETPADVGLPPMQEKPAAPADRATNAPVAPAPANAPVSPLANIREVEAKPVVPGFKKGDPIGEIRDRDGMLIAEDAKVLRKNEDGTYEIEFIDPDTGKRLIATTDEASLVSPISPGKVDPNKTVFPASPVTPQTPFGAATAPTPPTAATTVTPKQVENVARPQGSVATPNLRPGAADVFAKMAPDPLHAENRKKIAEALKKKRSERDVLETDYYSAASTMENPDKPVRDAQRAAADAVDRTGKPNPFRQIFKKVFVPLKWSIGKLKPEVNARLYGASAELQPSGVFGMSVDKVGQNLKMVQGMALNDPAIARVLESYGVGEAYLNGNEIVADFQNYLDNHAHGYGGGGEKLSRPADTRPGSVTPEDPNFTPVNLPANKRQLFNLILGFEQQINRTPGMEFSDRFAKQNGIDPLIVGFDAEGKPLTDNNALRADLRQKTNFNIELLNSGIEQLGTEKFTTPLKVREDVRFPAADSGIGQAGFMPEASVPRRPQGNDETRSVAAQYTQKAGIQAAPHNTYAPTNETTLKRIADFYEPSGYEEGDRLELPSGKIVEFVSDLLPKKGGARDGAQMAYVRFDDGMESSVYLDDLTKTYGPGGSFMPEAPDTPEFKKWTRGAPVVLAGESHNFKTNTPVVVEAFHGSTVGGIERTSLQKAFFSDSPEVANTYAEPLDTSFARAITKNMVVQKAFVNMQRPLVVDASGAKWHKIPFKGDAVYDRRSERGERTWTTDDLANYADRAGYDGLIVKNVVDDVGTGDDLPPSTVFVTLGQKGQIKSATGNRGTFDPTNPDIRYMPEVQFDAPKRLPDAIKDRTLTLVHKGPAGVGELDPARFGKSGITPRSELAGEPRVFFYVKGFENKGDPSQLRGNTYEIPISGKRIYDGDTDALDWTQDVNRQRADIMLKDAGYAGLIRTRGKGKNLFKQVEIFEKVSVDGTPVSETDVRTPRNRLETPEGRKVAAQLREKFGSTGAYFDRLQEYKETGNVRFMPEGKRRVEEAAIRFDGEIFTGKTHYDAFEQMRDQGFVEEGADFDDIPLTARGFLDNKGKFLTRTQAAELAMSSGQIDSEGAKQAIWAYNTDRKELEAEGFQDNRRFMPEATLDQVADQIVVEKNKGASVPKTFGQRYADQAGFPEAVPLTFEAKKDGSVVYSNKEPKILTRPYDFFDTTLTRELGIDPDDMASLKTKLNNLILSEVKAGALETKLTDGEKAAMGKMVEAYAQRAVDDFSRYADDPQVKGAAGWYSDIAEFFKKIIPNEANRTKLLEFLGGTSPNTDVETNFLYALDLYNRYKKGELDGYRDRHNSLVANFDSLASTYAEQVPVLSESGKPKTAGGQPVLKWQLKEGLEKKYRKDYYEALLKDGVKPIPARLRAKNFSEGNLWNLLQLQNDVAPRRAGGGKYGMHSDRILQIMNNEWRDKTDAPKAPNFTENLAGLSTRATIDVWAARWLRRLGYDGITKEPWRLLPMMEQGVGNADFFLGQEIFEKTTKRINEELGDKLGRKINPDDLQAIMWFAEKREWARRGWSVFEDLGDFRNYTDRLTPNEDETFHLANVTLNRSSIDFLKTLEGVELKNATLSALDRENLKELNNSQKVLADEMLREKPRPKVVENHTKKLLAAEAKVGQKVNTPDYR